MAVKLSAQGALMYATMLLYAAAFGLLLARRRRAGMTVFAGGFAVAAASCIFRWWRVEHFPLQNLFEVFLCLGALIFPLSVLCRRYLQVSGEAVDALIGFVMLWPAGFVFGDVPRKLPPALLSPLFVPHVAVYVAAYVIMAKAAVQALGLLLRNDEAPEPALAGREVAAHRLVCLGFPLLTAGLLLGAWWGKLAWGDYWHWDPKELWALATWLTYAAYLHFRAMHGPRHPRVNAVFVVAGMAAIIITLLWVNLAKIFTGLHSYAL